MVSSCPAKNNKTDLVDHASKHSHLMASWKTTQGSEFCCWLRKLKKNEQEHEFYCSYHKIFPHTSYNAVGKQDLKQNCLGQEQGWCTSMASLVLNQQYLSLYVGHFPNPANKQEHHKILPKERYRKAHTGKTHAQVARWPRRAKQTCTERTSEDHPGDEVSSALINQTWISRFFLESMSSNTVWFRNSSHHLGYITNLS